VCYIGNLVISFHPIPPSLSETEIENRSSPDSGRNGGSGTMARRATWMEKRLILPRDPLGTQSHPLQQEREFDANRQEILLITYQERLWLPPTLSCKFFWTCSKLVGDVQRGSGGASFLPGS